MTTNELLTISTKGSMRATARLLLGVTACAALAGCGSSGAGGGSGASGAGGGSGGSAPGNSAAAAVLGSTIPHGHPHAVEPTAGVQAGSATTRTVPLPLGNPNSHAPPLSVIKQELKQLNLCGGATSAALAQPIVAGGGPGFVPDPGTVQDVGELPVITRDLNALGKALGVTIYGISGYRSPRHSVEVGGYANDPHTRGEAEDIGVNSLLRSSAAGITEAELARYGLYRPFDPSDDPSNTEVNHVQLIPSGGPLSLAAVQATFAPDPSCR